MIALDANGADAGAAAVAEGARRSGVPVTAFGPVAELAGLEEAVDAPDFVSNEEDAVSAVRTRPGASIVQAARAVAEGRCDALVTAGSTGAALAASLVHIRRQRGVHRPALAVVIPMPDGPMLLLDAGANVEVRPEHLVQFAYMGAAFMEAVHGVERPRVGLLSVGEEAGKGTPTVVAAYERLAGAPLHFVGNVEGTSATAGVADVVVTDGFTGNVALKLMEGTSRTVVAAIREAITANPVSAVGGLLVRGSLGALRERLDPNKVGGAILLGLRGVCVVAHGSSTPEGIASAIRLARRAVDERMVERTHELLARGGALRSAPVASVAGDG